MIAISFYNSNINPEIVEHQKKVFDFFGIELIQYKYGEDHRHGFAIDWWLHNMWDKYQFEDLAIFDIDCIPLHKDVLARAEAIVSEGYLYGAAQRANHIKGSDVYCSPAFFCFTKEQYERANRPTFQETTWHDVGGFATNEFVRTKSAARLLWPTHVEVPMWDLTERTKFGYGTTYQDTVYHAFESRFNHDSTNRFIEKCKSIIYG